LTLEISLFLHVQISTVEFQRQMTRKSSGDEIIMKLQRFLFPRFLSLLLLALMTSFTAGRVAPQSGNEPYRQR
jgi:hypothetical protein